MLWRISIVDNTMRKTHSYARHIVARGAPKQLQFGPSKSPRCTPSVTAEHWHIRPTSLGVVLHFSGYHSTPYGRQNQTQTQTQTPQNAKKKDADRTLAMLQTSTEKEAFKQLMDASKYVEKLMVLEDLSATQQLLNVHCALSYAEKAIDALLRVKWTYHSDRDTWTGLPLTSIFSMLEQIDGHSVIVEQQFCKLVQDIKKYFQDKTTANTRVEVDPLSIRRLITLSYLQKAMTNTSDIDRGTLLHSKDTAERSAEILSATFQELQFLRYEPSSFHFGVQCAFIELCIFSGLPETATTFLDRADAHCTEEQRIKRLQPLVAVLHGLTERLRTGQHYSSGTDALLAYIWDFMHRVSLSSIDALKESIDSSDGEVAFDFLEAIEMDSDADLFKSGGDSDSAEAFRLPSNYDSSQEEQESGMESQDDDEDNDNVQSFQLVDSTHMEAVSSLLTEERQRFSKIGDSSGAFSRLLKTFDDYYARIGSQFEQDDFEKPRLVRAVNYLRETWTDRAPFSNRCRASDSKLLKHIEGKGESYYCTNQALKKSEMAPTYFLKGPSAGFSKNRNPQPSLLDAGGNMQNTFMKYLQQGYIDSVTVVAETALQNRRLKNSRRQRILKAVREKALMDSYVIPSIISLPMDMPPGQQQWLPFVCFKCWRFMNTYYYPDSSTQKKLIGALRRVSRSLVNQENVASFINEILPSRRVTHAVDGYSSLEDPVIGYPTYQFEDDGPPFTSLPIIAEGLRFCDSQELLSALDRWQYQQATLRRAQMLQRLSSETKSTDGCENSKEMLRYVERCILSEVGVDVEGVARKYIPILDPLGDTSREYRFQYVGSRSAISVSYIT